MQRYKRGVRISQLVTLLLLTVALTSCSCWKRTAPTTLMGTSVVTKIHKGELPTSPEVEGWVINDAALALILERAERPCSAEPGSCP